MEDEDAYMKVIRKIWKWGCLSVLLLLLLLLTGATFFMLDFALSPNPGRQPVKAHYALLFQRHPEVKPWVDSLLRTKTLRDTFVTMPTGEQHHALLARHPMSPRRVAMVIHGWRNSAIDFLHLASFYYQQLGYSILLPDLHAHGQSEGESIGMGWQERFDVLHWMEVAAQALDCDTFVVHGVSMGAATAMNASGEPMPDCVKDVKFIEDCGYTSVWDEFDLRIGEEFSLPDFPLLYASSLLCKVRYGWSFGEASPLEQVKKCRHPMFFIHGDDDHFVPSWMVHPLYKAKPGTKRLWVTRDADHNMSYYKYPEEYVRQVKAFLK